MDALDQYLRQIDLFGKTPVDFLGIEDIDFTSAVERFAEINYDELVELYIDDPVSFAEDILNFYPDAKQREIMESVLHHKRTAVRSGQGVGKTGCVACLIIWYMLFRENAKIIATAPTAQQLNIVLWPEIAKWLGGTYAAEFLTLTKTMLYMNGFEMEWFAAAKTATRKENMAGLHADNLLIIVDEASGVSDEILETLLGTITGADNKILFISNPTKNSGIFFDAFHGDCDKYSCIHINAEKSARTDKENIAMLIRKYGADSNVVRVRVHGDFPSEEADIFIQLRMVMRAIQTEFDAARPIDAIHIACDVARMGDDETVIGAKLNEKVLPFLVRRGQDTMKTVGDIMRVANRLHDRYPGVVIPVKIDDTGVGGGVTDRLMEIKKLEALDWLRIVPVIFGTRIRHKYYYDFTTFMAGIVRELMEEYDDQGRPKACELVLPDDNELIAQLTSRRYEVYDSNGKIKIESKKEMKKRGLPSPDRADCLFLLCLPIKIKVKKEEDQKQSSF